MTERLDIKETIEKSQSESVQSLDTVSSLKLKKEELELGIKQEELEQERLHKCRLEKNNERRPVLYLSVCRFIFLMYCALFVVIVGAFVFPCLASNATQFHIVALVILALVPTVLTIALLKAMFTPRSRKGSDQLDIKLSDSTPLGIVGSAIRHNIQQ